MRDYRLYELSSSEFERLVIHICHRILGMGTLNFSEGPDGGRDGKFEGVANSFPSNTSPWKGKFIVQAKRTANPIASCSDADFMTKIIDIELPKLKKLKQNNELDNYLLFTTRKLSANAHSTHVNHIKKEVSIDNVEILGQEKICLYLTEHSDLVKICNLDRYRNPLRINADDVKQVITAFYQKRQKIDVKDETRFSFKHVKLDIKNELNKLSEQYFKYIQENSQSYFEQITMFLKNPINKEITEYYYNVCDEIKGKTTIRRNEFAQFEEIFEYLYDFILQECRELQKIRRFVNVFLHYMYCNCDIGEKC